MIIRLSIILDGDDLKNPTATLEYEEFKWTTEGRPLWPREVKLMSAVNDIIKDFNTNEKSHRPGGESNANRQAIRLSQAERERSVSDKPA
jgi:hypothetical protein